MGVGVEVVGCFAEVGGEDAGLVPGVAGDGGEGVAGGGVREEGETRGRERDEESG